MGPPSSYIPSLITITMPSEDLSCNESIVPLTLASALLLPHFPPPISFLLSISSHSSYLKISSPLPSPSFPLPPFLSELGKEEKGDSG